MSVIESPTVIESPRLDDGTGDPESLTHIVNQHLPGNSLADAMVFGTEVVALCGHRFIPYRDMAQFPVCKPCRDALAQTT